MCRAFFYLTAQKLTNPFSLPIVNQTDYIRQALLAGKHVLSEKPVAENLRDAQELMKWYYENINTKSVTWSVAENFRYLNSFEYAREQVHRAGKLLQFKVKAHSMVKSGGKYYGKGSMQFLSLESTTKSIKRPNGANSLRTREAFSSTVESIRWPAYVICLDLRTRSTSYRRSRPSYNRTYRPRTPSTPR